MSDLAALRQLKHHIERKLDQSGDREMWLSDLVEWIEELEQESREFCQTNHYRKSV